MKVLIAIPTAGKLPVEFISCIDSIKSKHEIARLYIARSLVHVAREQAADTAIKGGYDALLFLDDDMVFEPNVVDVMLEANEPVVSAPCFKRAYPYEPCFYEAIELNGNALKAHPCKLREMPDKPFRVASAGTACMMIRTNVFEKLKRPWFLPLPYSGEDLTFCMRLAKEKIGIVVQPKARVGHLETRAIYFEHYKEALENADNNGGTDNAYGGTGSNKE